MAIPITADATEIMGIELTADMTEIDTVGVSIPPPSKVLAGVEYGPNGDDYTGTAPQSERATIPYLVRGDDYPLGSDETTSIIAALSDAGAVGSCSCIFAGWSDKHQTGWKVTGGTVTDLGAGLWKMQNALVSADTLDCKPDCEYRWTHTLVDASGRLRTQVKGVTKLVDGYAVSRFVES